MSELLQPPDMDRTAFVVTPEVTLAEHDVMESSVLGAAFDIRQTLLLRIFERDPYLVSQEFFAALEYEQYVGPDVPEREARDSKTTPDERVKVARFILDNSAFELAPALSSVHSAILATNSAENQPEEIFDGSARRVVSDMIANNDQRDAIFESLASLGIGDKYTQMYSDSKLWSQYVEENAELAYAGVTDNYAIPVIPGVPLELRSEEVKKIIPDTHKDAIDPERPAGYAVVRGNVMYRFREQFPVNWREGPDYMCVIATAHVLHDEGVDTLYELSNS